MFAALCRDLAMVHWLWGGAAALHLDVPLSLPRARAPADVVICCWIVGPVWGDRSMV